jgi:peroxiredoxin
MITIGAQVPEFELKDQNGTVISSSALRGKSVLLSFHPLAWTGVCQRQMEALEMNALVFADLNAQALGISVDSAPCKKAWAESMNVKETPLLADFWPHGGLAQALGIFRDADGISERANVIVDGAGIVQWIKVYPIGDLPNLEDVIQVLRDLNS